MESESSPNENTPEELPTQAGTTQAGTAHGVTGQPVVVNAVIQQPPDKSVPRWFAWLGWLLLALAIPTILALWFSRSEYLDNSGGITERFVSGSSTSDDKIAIIKVTGTIMSGDGYVKRQIDRVRKDKKVCAVVLRVNSPGGTVTGSDYIYHHLTKLRDEAELPIVVSMGGMAASGGYYVAMAVGDQEKSIYAEPTTTTGSIGVIIPHYNVADLMKEYGVENDSIVSHPRKQLLSMTKELPPEHREILQRYVDQSFDRFKDIVKSGRPKFRADEAALDALATGEIFTATQAQKVGLVDELGFIEEAIERAAELGGVDAEDARVVSYSRPMTLIDALGVSVKADSLETAILEMTVPRAYYILTTVPGLVRSSQR